MIAATSNILIGLHKADRLLRPRPVRVPRLHVVLLIVLVAGLCDGAVMGSYGGVFRSYGLQPLYSALKVPLLLLGTFALTVPSFYVLNTLMGLRTDFGVALRSLVAAQAVLALVLASLTPYVALMYVSGVSYPAAILFNGVTFGIASVAAQWPLRRFYRPLIQRDPRHRLMLRAWLVIYIFVGIQMGWMLRPFIGAPGKPARFFREDTWGNAYIVLWELFRSATGW